MPFTPHRIAEADLLHQLLACEMTAVLFVEPAHTVVAEAAVGHGIVVVRAHIVIDPHAPRLKLLRVHPDLGKRVFAEMLAVPAEAILRHRAVRPHHMLDRGSVVHQSGAIARRHILPVPHAVGKLQGYAHADFPQLFRCDREVFRGGGMHGQRWKAVVCREPHLIAAAGMSVYRRGKFINKVRILLGIAAKSLR